MMRIISAKPVSQIIAVIHSLGANFHLGESRSVVIMTPEDFARCIGAARGGSAHGVVEFLNDHPAKPS